MIHDHEDKSLDRLAWDRTVSDSSSVVRGTYITADHVLSLVVDGWNWDDIRRAYPRLRKADIRACMAYLARPEAR
jgi:uncharacterized protein (DUF433 family)